MRLKPGVLFFFGRTAVRSPTWRWEWILRRRRRRQRRWLWSWGVDKASPLRSCWLCWWQCGGRNNVLAVLYSITSILRITSRCVDHGFGPWSRWRQKKRRINCSQRMAGYLGMPGFTDRMLGDWLNCARSQYPHFIFFAWRSRSIICSFQNLKNGL